MKKSDLKAKYYPIYPNSVNGYTYYYDIHLYLLSKKENMKKPIYPQYINDKIKDEIDSAKKCFRNICLNYDLNSYNELCFKKLKNRNNRFNKCTIKNRHKSKNLDDYYLLKIPYNFDYYKKLNDLHVKKCHCSLNILSKEFMRLGYTYKGLYKDCKNIIEFCHICSQKKKEYYKREPTKQLIFTHPNERLLADLTELPFELKENNKYKFLLNVIDHFSKYSWSYLLENKKSETVFHYIKECSDIIGFPEQFGTDNGTEFANYKLKHYLAQNNIKFIHGKAFNPRSQGCVERLHRTIKLKLLH